MIPAARFTPQEREWVLDSVIASQALAGVHISRERCAALLDEVERAALVDIMEAPCPTLPTVASSNPPRK